MRISQDSSALFKERGKDSAHFPGGKVHTFRVPLDTKEKRVRFVFNCLDHSVRRYSTDAKTGSGFLDSLMVKAVDFCLFTDEVGEESLLFALDQVNRIMPKHGIGIMVKEARIFGQILIDRAVAGKI